MFGNASLPSRIWSYGARAPIVGADIVDVQMRLAHRYRNALVERELARRKSVDDTLRTLSPDLISCEAAILAEEARLEAARKAVAAHRVNAGDKSIPAQAKADAESAKLALRGLRAMRKALRTALFADPRWIAEQERIDAHDLAERKRLRGASGLYWCNYLIIEQAMGACRRGAPPRFQRWDGDGHLAVQFQASGEPSPTWADILHGEDTRLRVREIQPARGDGAVRCVVDFRVGSNGDRSPVFAAIPVVLHRIPPPDARVKWAHLIRRRIACTSEWRLQLVLARECWDQPDRAKTGCVGIDVGWRMRPDGSLRVAYWHDDAGASGELVLPADWLREMRRTETIRSERDKNFNAAREDIAAWLNGRTDLPAWLTDARATIRQWRSPARLAALVIRWRRDPIPGDDAAYDLATAWRERDRHLYEFEGNLRDQLQRRREDIYRVFAAQMRRRYRTAKIELLDLRDFHVLPKVEDGAADPIVRMHTRDACLSALIRCLKESMAETVEVDAAETTMRCQGCGHVTPLSVKQRRRVKVSCPTCGVKIDQDLRAAVNVLASVGVP